MKNTCNQLNMGLNGRKGLASFAVRPISYHFAVTGQGGRLRCV